MAYVLDGGPRSGQLVDDLPVGYTAFADAGSRSIRIFDGFDVESARWNPMAAAQRRWRTGRD